MKRLLTPLIITIFFLINSIQLLAQANQSYSDYDYGHFGIRAGGGTDIDLGLGYGAGFSYILPYSSLELTAVYFGHSSEETTEEFHTYTEKTDLSVFGIMGNYLIGYHHNMKGFYGIVGFGFSAVSVDWEESSPTDISLGTPLPGGGSKQSASGANAGSILNAGFGISFGQLNLRAEFPVLIAFAAPGDASAVAPTFIATLGYFF